MTAPRYTLVGIGDDGLEGLGTEARSAIDRADVLVASGRLHQLVPQTTARRLEWPRPFSAMVPELAALKDEYIVILATGDPMNFGVGRKLLNHFDVSELRILPHVSAFSLAAARMGWSLPDVATISLHGRAVSLIEPLIQPIVRILALTAGQQTIREAADRLCRRGFGQSQMTVLAHMQSKTEQRFEFTANSLPEDSFPALSTLAIECHAGSDASVLARVPGLPDEAFEHDGQMTKREIRAVTLSSLKPLPGQLLWDIGAGCGSVAIEWMRSHSSCRAIAFERNPERLEMIGQNADRLGAPALEIIKGEVPETLSGQTSPDAVFLGGAVASEAVFNVAWQALQPGGRFVANAVTLEGEAHLMTLQRRHGGSLMRLQSSVLTEVGARQALRPRMAILQWVAEKP